MSRTIYIKAGENVAERMTEEHEKEMEFLKKFHEFTFSEEGIEYNASKTGNSYFDMESYVDREAERGGEVIEIEIPATKIRVPLGFLLQSASKGPAWEMLGYHLQGTIYHKSAWLYKLMIDGVNEKNPEYFDDLIQYRTHKNELYGMMYAAWKAGEEVRYRTKSFNIDYANTILEEMSVIEQKYSGTNSLTEALEKGFKEDLSKLIDADE